ncbi:MAG: isoprenylcysteine carboxylmethyltransferase family protein [Spirochaetales bacterium]|nr:isoprenylcysteine carboxylmethyltransferase family protein [Spirochaetales bacterium]
METITGGKIKKTIKKVLRILSGLIIMLTAFFLPAGTLFWVEAWVLIGIYLSAVTAFILWLKKYDPALLKERAEKKKEGKSWDKGLLLLYSILLIAMIITCGLDAVRFRWLPVPLPVQITGFAMFLPVMLIIFRVHGENTYASEVVRIQKDRGHHVISTGPYRFVRHPMYSGIIILMLSLPLALGSFIAESFSILIIIVFVIRTCREDTTLMNELPGYKEYAEKVRFRLIPGIW